MTRAFITLLLLAVFFLSGMLFGMDNGQQEQQDTSGEKQETEMNEDSDHEIETIEVVDDPESEPGVDTDDDSKQFSQKSAAFLGGVIQGFYELVITVFYQFAQLFF